MPQKFIQQTLVFGFCWLGPNPFIWVYGNQKMKARYTQYDACTKQGVTLYAIKFCLCPVSLT